MTDLLDILSNGNAPSKIMKHMSKIFQSIDTLKLVESGARPAVDGMEACVGKEYVKFTRELKLVGKVEFYLELVINCMRDSLKDISLTNLK